MDEDAEGAGGGGVEAGNMKRNPKISELAETFDQFYASWDQNR